MHLGIQYNEISDNLLFLNILENHVVETFEIVKQIIMLFQCILNFI